MLSSWELDKTCQACELMFWFSTKVNISYSVFFRWYMYVNSFLDVSVHFKSKTNLLFIRERIIIPVYVNSLSECAMRCFCPTKCISFFNENFDLFCQWKAKSYVSLIAALQIHGSIAVIITLPLKWRYIYEFNTCNT